MKQWYAFRALYLFLILFFAGRLSATAQTRTIAWIGTPLNSDQTIDGFYESLPTAYTSNNTSRYPVIIYLHGDESVEKGREEILENGIPKLISEGNFPETFKVRGQNYSFIVIAPHFTTKSLTPDELDEAFNYITRTYRTDPDRIYLTGMSRGSAYTWEFAGASNANATKLAAIVPVSNAFHTQEKKTGTTIGDADLPVMATHNDEDEVVPASYTLTYVDWVNERNPKTPANKKLFKSKKHEGWTETYDPDSKEFTGKNIYEWMLQYTTSTEAALPVKLTSYKAYQSAPTEITINWQTGSEIATGSFTLERSATENGFTKIAMLPATESNTYTYIDKTPLPGTNYYRLSQTEPDGITTYFPILQTSIAATTKGALALHPNPVTGQALLQITDAEPGTVTFSLFTAGGMLVQQWTAQKETATYQQAVSFSNLKPGSYVLQAQAKTFRQSLLFVKK